MTKIIELIMRDGEHQWAGSVWINPKMEVDVECGLGARSVDVHDTRHEELR